MPTARRKSSTTPKSRRTAAPAKAPNLHAVVGSDEGKVKEAARRKADELAPADAGDFGVEVIDGVAEHSDHAARICAETIQALQTVPFFGGEKLVWLKNVNFAADTVLGRSEATLSGLENLAEILAAGVPSDVRFLFSAIDIDKRRTFFRTLGEIAHVEVHDRPSSGPGWERDIMGFVSERARERGLSFRRDALEAFAMTAGEDSRIVGNELEKLDLFLGDRREVRLEDVHEIVSLGRGGMIFEIGDAIGKRDLARALDRVAHFLFRGETPVGLLLAAIVPKVRTLLLAKDLSARFRVRASGHYRGFQEQLARLPAEAVAHLPKKKDGAPNAYPLFLASSEAEGFRLDHLRDALEACLEANLRLVSSSLEPKVVLEQLLARILTGEGVAPRRARPAG